MSAESHDKKEFEESAPVSYRLQFYSVVVGFAAIIIQTLFYSMEGGWQQVHGINLRYLIPVFLSETLFPLVLFLVTFYTTKRTAVPINRWFVAMVKTFLALTIFAMLQTMVNIISLRLYTPWGYHGAAPSWITNNSVVYLSMGLVLVGMGALIWRSRRK